MYTSECISIIIGRRGYMSWELNTERPIYLQLMDYIKLSIISGKYKSGEKLLSVRELASNAAVNPNTMQKALVELEQTGLIYTNRTSGRFITDDKELIHSLKTSLAKEYCNELMIKLRALGLTDVEIHELLIECTD